MDKKIIIIFLFAFVNFFNAFSQDVNINVENANQTTKPVLLETDCFGQVNRGIDKGVWFSIPVKIEMTSDKYGRYFVLREFSIPKESKLFDLYNTTEEAYAFSRSIPQEGLLLINLNIVISKLSKSSSYREKYTHSFHFRPNTHTVFYRCEDFYLNLDF